MLGKDIYCAEEAVFGKGGWGVMGRGLEIPCSKETGLAFLATLGFSEAKIVVRLGPAGVIHMRQNWFLRGLTQPGCSWRAPLKTLCIL